MYKMAVFGPFKFKMVHIINLRCRSPLLLPQCSFTPPTPETVGITEHPLAGLPSNSVYGNYGRARSVVDGDFDDYPDSARFPRKAKSVAGSLRLSVAPKSTLNHTGYSTQNSTLNRTGYSTQNGTLNRYSTQNTVVSNGVRKSYPAAVPVSRVGAVVNTTGRLYRPIERVYFPHGAPSDIRRRAQSAPRPRH